MEECGAVLSRQPHTCESLIMKKLFFLLLVSHCFATRFQTIWEKMEFPADSQTVFTFGRNCCGVGDINADGYADFLVNRLYYGYNVDTLETLSQKVYLFLGKKYLTGKPDICLEHNIRSTMDDCFGCLMGSLGDVNGDGFDDFAIVAGHAITDTTPWGEIAFGGKVYIYFGSPTPDTIPELILKGNKIPDSPFWIGGSFATAVCGADVNGDGYKDIVIGSSDYSPTWNWYDCSRGRVYIYFGGPNIDTIPNVIITGGNYWAPFPARYEQLGFAIDNLGDVNGDGYEDIIVGAPNNMEHGELGAAGKAYVFLGGNPMDTLPDWWYYGTQDLQCFGEIVSNAGDFNGDGYKDFMVGDYFYPEPWYSFGRVLLFYGGPVLDTFPDWVIYGEPYRTHDLGNSLDCIGDYDGDGYDDIVIGNSAYEYNANNDWFNGRILLYFGGEFPDTIPDAVYIGIENYERGVARILGNAGDVNGDGINEIIFTTDYPPIVPYPDVYGWVRVMKITEAGLPDSITCRGGDCYVIIKWHGKFEENTSYYQVLKNNSSDTLGWHQLKTLNPAQPAYYTIIDTAVDFSQTYYYWVRAYGNNGRFDHYGPFQAQPSPIQVNDFSGYWELGGFVNLCWHITGGDITVFNLYQEINNIKEKIAVLTADRTSYSMPGADKDVCYWLGIMQSSGKERLIGPLVPDGIVSIMPNPFRNQVRIGLQAGKDGIYSLKIYNVLGQYIRTLWSGEKQAGYYEISWDGRDEKNRQMPAGVYYLIYEMGTTKTTAKLVLLR